MDELDKIIAGVFALLVIILIISIRASSNTEYDQWFKELRDLAFQHQYSDEDIECWSEQIFFYEEFINEVTPEQLLIKIKNQNIC
jgi:hypothetical protein